MKTFHTPRVSHAKPHTSGKGWHVTLDCGHTIYSRQTPGCVGALEYCNACIRAAEKEGCGGDAILDRMVS